MGPRTRPTTSTLSPPPSPPQTTTSKYHVRRKSGHRPTLSRRQTSSKSSTRINKLSLPAPEPSEEHFQYDDEDESFFNFCTTCDKQLAPSSGNYLYCSEACRHLDTVSSSSMNYPASPPLTPFGFGIGGSGGMTFPQLHERHSPMSIYERSPRLVPTHHLAPSPYGSHTHTHERKTSRDSVSALDSLRSLSRALDASTSPKELEHEILEQYSTEEEDSEDDDDEPETYRRLSGTPHPGKVLYGTYINERIGTPESRPCYTSGRPLP